MREIANEARVLEQLRASVGLGTQQIREVTRPIQRKKAVSLDPTLPFLKPRRRRRTQFLRSALLESAAAAANSFGQSRITFRSRLRTARACSRILLERRSHER